MLHDGYPHVNGSVTNGLLEFGTYSPIMFGMYYQVAPNSTEDQSSRHQFHQAFDRRGIKSGADAAANR